VCIWEDGYKGNGIESRGGGLQGGGAVAPPPCWNIIISIMNYHEDIMRIETKNKIVNWSATL
jgi:hypothetical protein